MVEWQYYHLDVIFESINNNLWLFISCVNELRILLIIIDYQFESEPELADLVCKSHMVEASIFIQI